MGPLAPLALLFLVLVAPAGAETRSYSIESFQVSLHVNPDASLLVQETIAFAFRGSHQGISRTIPIRYERQGFHYDLRIDGVQVLDDRGGALRTEVSYPGRSVKIKAWVPGAQDATRTVMILYRVRRALLAFDDHDELYWNAVGTEWEAPIRSAEAVVGLPPTVPMDSVRSRLHGTVRRRGEGLRAGPGGEFSRLQDDSAAGDPGGDDGRGGVADRARPLPVPGATGRLVSPGSVLVRAPPPGARRVSRSLAPLRS